MLATAVQFRMKWDRYACDDSPGGLAADLPDQRCMNGRLSILTPTARPMVGIPDHDSYMAHMAERYPHAGRHDPHAIIPRPAGGAMAEKMAGGVAEIAIGSAIP